MEHEHEEIRMDMPSPIRERKHIENKKYENSWEFCCSRSSKECIKYSTQITIASIVLVFSLVMIGLDKDDDKVFLNLVSFVIGLIFPNPSLK